MNKLIALFVVLFYFSPNLWSHNPELPALGAKQLEIRTQLIKSAKNYLGISYKFGGCTAFGFDCSGLMQKIYAENGIDIQRTAADQAKMGTTLSSNELNSGDLVFFGDNKKDISHVGIVVRRSDKNLIVIHSTSSGGVMIDDIETSKYWKKRLQYGVDVLSNIF